MGQAWCKEKSTKAQDSKSPLDRVFLRCAHRIYPGLKEEGSVLGGATQRVTSSEIGYASSPPREVLTRVQSIDSVDRPFHPNDWVDVNLEVPETPRATPMMTNLTLNNVTLTDSSGSKLRDLTPVPPPRRRKKNRGRPLPPKPDEHSRSHVDRIASINSSKDSRNSRDEPLYSFVKSLKTSSGEKLLFEHKVNGTGKVIPNIAVAAHRSSREKSNRGGGDRKKSRPKNSSTVSLPNYWELQATHDTSLCEDEGELKVHKITAAESLPLLITSGALGNLKNSGQSEEVEKTIKGHQRERDSKPSVDEVDFSFDQAKNDDTLNLMMLEGPRLTSTPVKNNDCEDHSGSPTTRGGWFLHQDGVGKSDEPNDISVKNPVEKDESVESTSALVGTKSCRSDVFIEAEEDQPEDGKDNRVSVERAAELESERQRASTMANLKRSLSNESEPFDRNEEKEIRESESTEAALRCADSQVKLVDRSISEESLPREMLDHAEDTDFFEAIKLGAAAATAKQNSRNRIIGNKVISIEESVESENTKTPPPSPEPKIKPEIFDIDHSTLLKVLRDEAEESNLSSMTPSLTELEAALSDMLEREVDQENPETHKVADIDFSNDNHQVDRSTLIEKPIEPKIDVEKNINKSCLPVSLKNILGDSEKPVEKSEDDSLVEIDLKNREKHLGSTQQHELVEIALSNSSRATIPPLEPPEKPSRLHQISLQESLQNSKAMPTPPRRRNRSSASGHSTTLLRENVRHTSETITATPEDPYPNDRLI